MTPSYHFTLLLRGGHKISLGVPTQKDLMVALNQLEKDIIEGAEGKIYLLKIDALYVLNTNIIAYSWGEGIPEDVKQMQIQAKINRKVEEKLDEEDEEPWRISLRPDPEDEDD